MQVPSPSKSRRSSEPAVDELLDRLLSAAPAEQPAVLAQLCADHPQLADGLRERFAALDRIGMLDRKAPEQVPGEIAGLTLLDCLGEGGMGIVYRAHERGLDREVAVKMLRPEFAWLGPQRQRFAREGRVVAQLEHPAIVRVLQVGEHEGQPYLAMQYVPGRSLADVVRDLGEPPCQPGQRDARALVAAMANGPEGVDEVAVAASVRGLHSRWSHVVASVLLPIAEALGYAHARGIVHRDVKPSNILLSRDGRPYLCDFGLATFADHDDHITRSGSLLGSVPYMSPEQVEGATVDPRSDVFSLGSVLYELLTLHRPFGSSSTGHTMHAITRDEPDALTGGAPDLDPDLVAILGKCLEKRPGRRYRDGAELAADLRAFLEDRPVAARRLTPVRRLCRYARREPMRFALAATTVVLALSLASIGGYVWAQQDVVSAGRSKLRAERIERHLARGYLAIFRNDWSMAKTTFDALLVIAPKHSEAEVGLRTIARLRDGDADIAGAPDTLFAQAANTIFAGLRGDLSGAVRATRLFRELMLSTATARPLLHGFLAKSAAQAGDEALATRSAEALLQLWPDSVAASYWAGYALVEFAPDRAAPAFERAIDLARNDDCQIANSLTADAWTGLGTARLQQGDHAGAVAALDNAVAKAPQDCSAWINLGLAHQAAGNLERAERALRRAADLPQPLPGAQYNLGVLLQATDTAAAIDAFAATVAQAPDYWEAWYNLGSLRTQTGELAAGRAALLEAVRLRPQFADAWRQLGTNEATAGNPQGAVDAYEHVVALAPEDEQARSYLETLLAHMRKQGKKP